MQRRLTEQLHLAKFKAAIARYQFEISSSERSHPRRRDSGMRADGISNTNLC